jgi:formylglycine-generating enzyme required for sulfatase activity
MTSKIQIAFWVAVVAEAAAGQQPFTTPKAGETRGNPRDGQRYVWVPAGAFAMGCSTSDGECGRGEPPAHNEVITNGFWIGRTEVTVGAYKRFIAGKGGAMPPDSQWNPGWKDSKLPIVNVTWDDADAFCKWAGGRLPSESEWEYAARSGNDTRGQGRMDAVAWYADNSGQKGPLAVGQKGANAWGLYDMLGNVWEWTTGLYPLTGKNDGPNLPASPGGTLWAIRGGSWGDAARLIRPSVRGRAETPHRSNSIGARCALDSL